MNTMKKKIKMKCDYATIFKCCFTALAESGVISYIDIDINMYREE